MELFKAFRIGEYDQIITLNGKIYRGEWVYGYLLTKKEKSYIVSGEDCLEEEEDDEYVNFDVYASKIIRHTICQYIGKDSLRQPIFTKHKVRYCASSDDMKKGIWEEEIVGIESISKIEELTKKKYHIKIIGDCFNTRTRKPIEDLEEALEGKTFQCFKCNSYDLLLDGKTGKVVCKKCKTVGKLEDFVEYENYYL
jgi:hypothetical protein